MADQSLLNILPKEDTDEGILARVFLAETIAPADSRFVPSECEQAMQLMMLCLRNRQRAPKLFAATGGTLRDIVRAKGQIEGFGNYPNISAAKQANILAKLGYRQMMEKSASRSDSRIKNAHQKAEALVPSGPGRDPFQRPPKLYFDLLREEEGWRTRSKNASREAAEGKLYVSTALEVASRKVIDDPTPGTLVFWRTAKASPPSKTAKLHATRSGNDFYYIDEKL